MKKSLRIILSAVITAVIAAVGFYFMLPAINVFNQEFWIYLTMVIIVFGVSYFLLGLKSSGKAVTFNFKSLGVGKVLIVLALIPVLVLVVGNIASSTFFNAQKYAQIINVEEAVFEEDMPESSIVNNIALMDSQTANIIGERTLGALSEVVSQYQVNGTYNQINYLKTPKKISSLEYGDFFKWMNNRDKGIPGYVMVDPVNSGAEYVKFAEPLHYSDSAYFGEDLHRALRFLYPTKIFGSYAFELDENGNPFYVVSCMAPKIGLFGAMDVNEVIIFNPVDGSAELYALENVPSWVDNVFTGALASQKFDWYGTLKNGYWNSVIGNKECKVTTDDFGYIVIEDDVWFFTGVTSVSNDESNIGFIISNARTGAYKFYNVIGAEEYSAMKAAEGEVQEKGYVASFPSLINISGKATYIMVLKDSGGLVKLYALVNVEQYDVVATGTTQSEAKQEYLKLLEQKGIISKDEADNSVDNGQEIAIEIADIRIITSNGESVMYITGNDGFLYKQKISENEELMLLNIGDNVKITYLDTNIDKIRQVITLKKDVAEVK